MRMILPLLLPWLASAALHAGPLLAYETPEEALIQQQMQTYITNYAPPNQRRVRQLTQDMIDDRSIQHPSTVFDPNLESNAAILRAASSSSAAAAAAAAAAAGANGTTDPSMLRLLERLQAQQDLRTNSVASQQSNPLAPTGMAEIVVAGVVAAAMGFTLLRARRKRI